VGRKFKLIYGRNLTLRSRTNLNRKHCTYYDDVRPPTCVKILTMKRAIFCHNVKSKSITLYSDTDV